jgi:hypothetical protein
VGVFVFWLVMAGVVALIANSKGKSGFAWFCYGFLIWPIALVHVLVAAPDQRAVETASIERGDTRKCPECAELIKREARRCRYCSAQIEAAP